MKKISLILICIVLASFLVISASAADDAIAIVEEEAACDVSYLDEGGFYWLSALDRANYKRFPVHKSPTEENPDFLVDDYTGCPEYITDYSGELVWKKYYPDGNVYELLVGGISSGFYSLIDFDGTGYYTILMGSPCQYAYLRAVFPAGAWDGSDGSFITATCRFELGTGPVGDVNAFGAYDASFSVSEEGCTLKAKNSSGTDVVVTVPVGSSSATVEVDGIEYTMLMAYVEANGRYHGLANWAQYVDLNNTVFPVIKAADLSGQSTAVKRVEVTGNYDQSFTGTISAFFNGILGWTGQVATALTSSSGVLNSLLPFFLLGVAVCVSMIIWKIIRKLCWGA